MKQVVRADVAAARRPPGAINCRGYSGRALRVCRAEKAPSRKHASRKSVIGKGTVLRNQLEGAVAGAQFDPSKRRVGCRRRQAAGERGRHGV